MTNYLQVVDTEVGRKLLAKPIKVTNKFDCHYPSIGDAGDAHVAIACLDEKGKPQAPLVFSIAANAITLTGKAISKRNPGVSVGAHGYEFYRSSQEPDAFFMEGEDGRKYRLDPVSGAVRLAEGELARAGNALAINGSLPAGLSEWGDGRRYISRTRGAGEPLRSQEDFLKPQYIVPADRDAREQLVADGGVLVLSHTQKDSGQHKLLTLVDAATLKTRWSTPLPQERGDWGGNFDGEQCVQQGDSLLLANASQLLRIDLATGRLIGNVSLVD